METDWLATNSELSMTTIMKAFLQLVNRYSGVYLQCLGDTSARGHTQVKLLAFDSVVVVMLMLVVRCFCPH